ncbi:MAG: NAD(P)-dependent oxidoreductase [Verrucomicrobiae bacterium]|nr:NAD(P)-dependent oxidoreductase [Verrucomicrobiae bacterium]
MKIGWIGTGVMGSAMAGHLLAAGHAVTVFNRTRAKAERLLAAGAHWAESPRAVTESSEITCTMVGFPQDVRALYFGEDGVLAGWSPGKVLVDFTTSSPSLAQEIAARATALDAPVSGGDVGARNATLSIMVGGAREAFEHVLPLLRLLGKTIVYHGPAGSGQHAKLANQIVIAGTMIGVCEALLYARRAGLDCNQLLESLRPGAAGCWTLDHLAPRILGGDFAPGFYAEHFLKDLGLALEEATRMGWQLPGVELARRLYQRACELGYARNGTQVLYRVLEELAKTSSAH